MRHRKKGRKLGRSLSERKALLRKLARSLILHERITTTEAKAKELRPFIERCITTARAGDLSARRRLRRHFGSRTVQRLVDTIAPRFRERPGGYTRIMRLPSRKGDAARMAVIELVQ